MDGFRLINFFVTSGKFQRGLLYALCCFFTLHNWAWPSALTASPFTQNILTSKQIETLSKVTCPEFPKMVSRYQQRFAQPIRIWSQAYLTKVNYSTVFYPFSGPDVVTILSMFPRADYLVLVADQLPEYQLIQSPLEAAGTTSEFECGMLEQFSQRGYYFTNDLIGKNGPKPRFIQLLIYNIAFSGAKILQIQMITVNSTGLILSTESGQQPSGLRFTLRTIDGRLTTVDYIQADLSNRRLMSQPQLVKAFERKSTEVVFIKSASHLLQNQQFSVMQEILVRQAKWVIQDETGIDITPLSANFDLELFGRFLQPSRLWLKSSAAERLVTYYTKHSKSGDLPFSLGYQKKGGSVLLIGQKK